MLEGVGEITPQFTITFGALAPSIPTQLKEQGVVIPEKDAERFEKIAWSIVHLHLNGIIPDSVRDSARKKLMKKISKCVHREEKE